MSSPFASHADWSDAFVVWAAHHASSNPNTAAIRDHMHLHNGVVIQARETFRAAFAACQPYVMALDYTPTPEHLESAKEEARAALRKAENEARKSLKGRLINR